MLCIIRTLALATNKLAFFRYMFNIDMDSNINSSISRLSICSMNDNQTAIVHNLKTLISVKGGSHVINVLLQMRLMIW